MPVAPLQLEHGIDGSPVSPDPGRKGRQFANVALVRLDQPRLQSCVIPLPDDPAKLLDEWSNACYLGADLRQPVELSLLVGV